MQRTKLKTVSHVSIQRQPIERERKSSSRPIQVRADEGWNELDREIKSRRRLNGFRDEAQWGMRSDKRRGANAIGHMKDAIERQKRAGEIKQMKLLKSLGHQ
jgi:hypothetical protein